MPRPNHKRPEDLTYSERELKSMRLMEKEGYAHREIGRRFNLSGRTIARLLSKEPEKEPAK